MHQQILYGFKDQLIDRFERIISKLGSAWEKKLVARGWTKQEFGASRRGASRFGAEQSEKLEITIRTDAVEIKLLHLRQPRKHFHERDARIMAIMIRPLRRLARDELRRLRDEDVESLVIKLWLWQWHFAKPVS